MSFDETAWWGDCANTFHEEEKQLAYATRMGLYGIRGGAHPPTYDLMGRSVIDIGGGPVSMLLKAVNFSSAAVVDPGKYPDWVKQRYTAHGVHYLQMRAEDLEPEEDQWYDEAWCYNVLQHVDDPVLVIANMKKLARRVRVFEWLDIEPYEGHPHRLDKDELDEWFGGLGFAAKVNERGAVGRAYYGVFST